MCPPTSVPSIGIAMIEGMHMTGMVLMTSNHTLKSRMRQKSHLLFGIGGGWSNPSPTFTVTMSSKLPVIEKGYKGGHSVT